MTRLILQEGLLELLLVLGTLTPLEVDVLRTAVFGNCYQIWRDHVLRVQLYVVEF